MIKGPKVISVLMLVSAMACGGVADVSASRPQLSISTAAKGGGGGGPNPNPPPPPPPPPGQPPPPTPVPAPGGGVRIPPNPTTDAAAWFFDNGSGSGVHTSSIDFSFIRNVQAGALSIGSTRIAQELIYNVSKKTALTITKVEVLGDAAADFSVPAADVASITSGSLAAQKGIAQVRVVFKPTAAGVRTAVVQFTSNAGIAQVAVVGVGLPNRPELVNIAPLNFFPTSAPAILFISNIGGVGLQLQSITIGGANASSFAIFPTQNGLGNCFNGELIGPLAACEIEVGVAPGATAPATGTLTFTTTDPVTPQMVVPLTIKPL